MLIKILFPLILLFLINLALYFSSEDYRFFVKKIKNSDQIVYVKDKKISDEEKDISLKSAALIEVKKNDRVEKKVKNEIKEEINKKVEQEKIEENPEVAEVLEPVIAKKEVVLGKKYMEVLELFSKYDLGKLELNSKLFDITDEYPDDYIEFFSSDLTLYFFPTKSYEDMTDIFTVLTHELPIKINEVNNFGTDSFYINLDENISDGRIRLVIGHESIIFGLKIKKDSYNEVKQILDLLKQDKTKI